MNIDALKAQINAAMPLLIANHNAACQEWMAGDISQGALWYIQSRLDTACAVAQRNDLIPEQAYKACAVITIDVRTAIKDNPAEQQQLHAWMECFRKAGFTETNNFFDIPSLPERATETQ